ncbi:MAG: helix-turn-helix transcriptional regulator [Gemmatimonadota bacterium]
MSGDLPSDVEQQVMLAVWRLGDEAYGVPVRDELERTAGREVTAGAVYTTLVRLEKKGWLRSSMGDPTPERGGKAKRFFRVTSDGVEALGAARAVMERLWDGLEVPDGAESG